MPSNILFVLEGLSCVLMNAVLSFLDTLATVYCTSALLPCVRLLQMYTSGHVHQTCCQWWPTWQGLLLLCLSFLCQNAKPHVRDTKVHGVPASPMPAAGTVGALSHCNTHCFTGRPLVFSDM